MGLVYYLNWTARTYSCGGLWHNRKLSASVVVFSRYSGHQKQMHFNLAITDFPGFFTRFCAKMVPNTGLRRDADRSPICVYIRFLFYASTRGVFESCLPVHTWKRLNDQIACITGALRAKRGERCILREACDEGRRKIKRLLPVQCGGCSHVYHMNVAFISSSPWNLVWTTRFPSFVSRRCGWT